MAQGYTVVFVQPPWWDAVESMQTCLAADDVGGAADGYLRLTRELVSAGYADPFQALADHLLFHPSALSRAVAQDEAIADGLRSAAEYDLVRMLALLRRDWRVEIGERYGHGLPPLSELAQALPEAGLAFSHHLRQDAAADVLAALLDRYRCHGVGILARFAAFRWRGGALEGIAHPANENSDALIGLDVELARLHGNTEAFLAGLPAQHGLLYGPRGSGKSTAIRSLASRYRERGLRLVELTVDRLADLPGLLEELRIGPHHYLIFVDDLSFEEGDLRYHPLKTLLEGNLSARPERVLLVATSNRRHLVREGFSERPDPLDDDVHAWDTVQERLALADRFGLVITFPSADQRRYLTIVRGLIEQDGFVAAEDLERHLEGAIRFASWNNGFSGRTARQYVDALRVDQLP